MILRPRQHLDTSLYEFLLIDTNTVITVVMALTRKYHYGTRIVRPQNAQASGISAYLIRILFDTSLAHAI